MTNIAAQTFGRPSNEGLPRCSVSDFPIVHITSDGAIRKSVSKGGILSDRRPNRRANPPHVFGPRADAICTGDRSGAIGPP
jgi:hypothetical protein